DHDFLIERPEILERSAAAAHDQHVDAAGRAELADGRRDQRRRTIALHRHGMDPNAEAGTAPLEYREDVADRRARRRGHDPDASWEHRQGSLPRKIEPAVVCQA